MSAIGIFFNKVIDGFQTEIKVNENNQAIIEQVKSLDMSGVACL
jgi:hypothetical protein